MDSEMIALAQSAPSIMALIAIGLGSLVLWLTKGWINAVNKNLAEVSKTVDNHKERVGVVEKTLDTVCIEIKEGNRKQQELENEISRSLATIETDLKWVKETLIKQKEKN